MLNCRTPSHANLDKQHIKKPLKTHLQKPKFFKKLFAAKEAVTRVLQTLAEVFNPPATPATTPKMPLKRE